MSENNELVGGVESYDLNAQLPSKSNKNRAKVGSARPSTLLYTYGPGAIVDLPNFNVLTAGYDAWDRIWDRLPSVPTIDAPRLLETVRHLLGPQVQELRPFPYQERINQFDKNKINVGVPTILFPQWLRCSAPKCQFLGRPTQFTYVNTVPYRPDLAHFEHGSCAQKSGKNKPHALPTRYVLACVNGHMDDFPYSEWVHAGGKCPSGAPNPVIAMRDMIGAQGASATILCKSCGGERPINAAQGDRGAEVLPRCRGRMPQNGTFAAKGCGEQMRLMLIGASNLWFPMVQSIIVLPRTEQDSQADQAAKLRSAYERHDVLEKRFAKGLDSFRDSLEDKGLDLYKLDDERLTELVEMVLAGVEISDAELKKQIETFDPLSLLEPEYTFLRAITLDSEPNPSDQSGLRISHVNVEAAANYGVAQILALKKLRKVNAVTGFTRIDEMERASDLPARIAPLSKQRPTWVVATEDRGEGIFISFDEQEIAKWEEETEDTDTWKAYEDAHERNFFNRYSKTSKADPKSRMKPARYWLLHSLSHQLIRRMAEKSGYGSASISERVYAWNAEGERPAAASILLTTTASDSDGTLGGLVQLAQDVSISETISQSLLRASRCSSDPICGRRVPRDPEDFLHGASCHVCSMVSETSCENGNRFLDRKMLVQLPGSEIKGFFTL